MKLHEDTLDDLNVITGYGDDHVLINGEAMTGNVIVLPRSTRTGWAPNGFDGLTSDDIAPLAALETDIVIIGTGSRQRFPSPAILRPLIDARIGMEIMDVAAACRTYNILVGENRNVAVALMFDAA
ncbi:Mth938-like domain-containing protein [Nitrogeniibacter aestuarii]|uniref:Mth938-like domain-containing protein n=1 Tax=Nitrogeniibacter aestuarii TaxID=2815343 RepID=UPI001D10221F|nr:Mth938-like domain-containing protein [Nitrogeniibacter aestuarii]